MEKFSAYRDLGTGIQPFLNPLPAPNPSLDLTAKLLFPVSVILGLFRTLITVLLLLVYIILVPGLCSILLPIPLLHRFATYALTAVIARTVLFVLGLFWIPVNLATKKRMGRVDKIERWNPCAGDVIVSNSASWVELLWLAFRFNPIFVMPITEDIMPEDSTVTGSSPISYTPGRRTGTGSANITSAATSRAPQVPILGFAEISLLSSIFSAGRTPNAISKASVKPRSIDDIRKSAKRPIVVFPECTTSNGRGLLKFANVFHKSVPAKGWNVFVMCVRYDPPTTFSPSLVHSIPVSFNPLAHVFALASSFSPPGLSIRLLCPSESPSSPLFVVSDIAPTSSGDDQLSEVCAALIAQIGKMKRLGMGWEDKARFLEFYRGKGK